MQVVGIVIFAVLLVFVTWLVIDTTIYVVKKVKQKRAKKAQQDNKVIEVIENTDNQKKVD